MQASSALCAKAAMSDRIARVVVRNLFMVEKDKKRLPCVSLCKGSLFFSKSVVGSKFIFFRRHRRHGFRRLSYDYSNLSCGLMSWNRGLRNSMSLSLGFHRCSCCPNHGLSLMMSCLCCSCCLMSLSCCFCCSYCCWSSTSKNLLMKMSSADVRILSLNATDGCCWARCSSGVRCLGCCRRWNCLVFHAPE